jgi:large subunit ribosomal protein L23
MHTYEVLRRPVLTEKSTVLQESSKYVFEVARGSTKPQIAEAVVKAFKVKVTQVNVMTVAGKKNRSLSRVAKSGGHLKTG